MNKSKQKQGEKPFTVVFVCTANICRSPMAEGVLKQFVAADDFKWNIKIMSAGVAATKGHKASVPAVQVCLDRGIAIFNHESQPVTKGLLKKADLVLAMTPEHKNELERLYPEQNEKVYLLKEYGRSKRRRDGNAIDDPYGGTKEEYETCFRDLRREIKRIVPVLKRQMTPACKTQNAECKMTNEKTF